MQMNLMKIESKLKNSFSDLIGLSFEDIAFKVGINPELITSKLSIVTLVNKMLEYKKINQKGLAEDIAPLQLSIKTIRLQPNGRPKESMSFEQIKFIKLANESWDESHIKRKFDSTVFLFVVFQYQKIGVNLVLFFKGIKMWKMPGQTLDSDVKRMWAATKRIITQGVEITKKSVGNKVITQNNLPGINDNPVAHIRPKAKDSNDTIELPDGKFITKQAYWLNSNYIGEVLNDLPSITKKDAQITIKGKQLSTEEIRLLISSFKECIYTFDEFLAKVKYHIPDFTVLDINKHLLQRLGYRVDSNFIINDSIHDANEYFETIIFKNDYFTVPDNTLFASPFAKRKIDNLENAYKLIKIEDNLYITDVCLKRANVTRDKLISFKTTVEQSVYPNQFFTINTLKASGFRNELDQYGFDNVFYESILKRPGRLKYLYMANQYLFIKTPYDININDFFTYLFDSRVSMSIQKIIEQAKIKCGINLDYDYVIKIFLESSYYFSRELQKLFKDKESFYDEVYKS